MNQAAAALLSLSTAVPPHQFHQSQVMEAAREVLAPRFPQFDYAGEPVLQYRHPPSLRRQADRMVSSSAAAGRSARKPISTAREALFIEVARKALAQADLPAADIDTIVTVSSTGIATPTLEARVAGQMGFRGDVSRVPVFGLGCAGGVSGLSIASRLAQARPGTNVLLVTLELCTLAVRHDELTKANIVALSLFGDGAAAAVLRAGDGGATRIEATGEKLWPDTLDIMGWSVDPEGFGVIFQRTIPDFVTENMGPAVTEILGRMQLDARRRRSLRLPSRRRQGDHGAGARAVARSGHARP